MRRSRRAPPAAPGPRGVRGRWAVACLLALALLPAGCGGFDPFSPRDLRIAGSGFGEHAGRTLQVAIVFESTGSVVGRGSATISFDGTFSFTFQRVMADSFTYSVDAYVDDTGNNQCDAPPADAQWTIGVSDSDHDGINDTGVGGIPSPVSDDVQIVMAYSSQFTNVCSHFD